MSNGVETLAVMETDSIIHQFSCDDAWHRRTDGDGYSLEIIDAVNSDLNSWGQAGSWQASDSVVGTRGTGFSRVLRDFNSDGLVNVQSIDLLQQQIADGVIGPSFDLNADQSLDNGLSEPVTGVIDTVFGDTDLDRDVDFTDFVSLTNNFN